MNESNIDLLVITEMWLRDKDESWKVSSCLNMNGLKFLTVGRTSGHRGGGIGLAYKEFIKEETANSDNKKFFEYGTWKIDVNSGSLVVVGINYPSPSETNWHTLTESTDEFQELFSILATENIKMGYS